LKKVAPNKLTSIPQETGLFAQPSFDSKRHTRKRPPPPRWTPHTSSVAKRIKLTIQHSGSEDVADNDHGEEETDDPIDDNNNNNNNNNSSDRTTTEKLTDFAYHQTSRVVRRQQQGQNRKWTLAAEGGAPNNTKPPGGPRNMGLVRVAPNAKVTPICPAFLRGVECQDKYCRKRHDVPKEFAMPICSFFQRRGQCLKQQGECIFRHVKVNPRALVCPSFSLLGFCEDQECAMKHVREGKKRSANQTTSASMKYVKR
jgi:hypothetical protein